MQFLDKEIDFSRLFSGFGHERFPVLPPKRHKSGSRIGPPLPRTAAGFPFLGSEMLCLRIAEGVPPNAVDRPAFGAENSVRSLCPNGAYADRPNCHPWGLERFIQAVPRSDCIDDVSEEIRDRVPYQ